MTDQPPWPRDLEQASALLREVPLAGAPAWWVALADRSRASSVAVREDWAWVWAAEVLAAFYPERLLPFMTALRALPTDRKRRALDAVGERLAVGRVEQPTFAACRAAIAEPDEAPRRRSIFCKAPAGPDVEATLLAVVLDVMDCEEQSLSRAPARAIPALDRSHTAGPQHRVVTTHLRSPTCTIEVVRSEEFLPGDVNQPASESEEIAVRGTSRDRSVTVEARVGDSYVRFDVDAITEERDRILATLWRAFGRPHRPPEEEWTW